MMIVVMGKTSFSHVQLQLNDRASLPVRELTASLARKLNCDTDDFYLLRNGSILPCSPGTCLDEICSNETIHVCWRIRGGKGGFGSMLRALGAQIEKTTNHEACRDLSGRRMRDVNNEKKIAEFLQKQPTVEEDRRKRRQEKLEKMINPPKHVVNDSSYTKEIQNRAEKVDDALRQALETKKGNEHSSSIDAGIKRKAPQETLKSKKQRGWLGIESESDDEEEDIPASVKPAHHQEDIVKTAVKVDQPIIAEIVSVAQSSNTGSTSEADDTCNSSKTKDVSSSTAQSTSIVDLKQNHQCPPPLPGKADPKNDKLGPVDLSNFDNAEMLESVGLDRLKCALVSLGLKCGGTLQQRAERLFSTKGVPKEKWDKSLISKPQKSKGKKQ